MVPVQKMVQHRRKTSHVDDRTRSSYLLRNNCCLALQSQSYGQTCTTQREHFFFLPSYRLPVVTSHITTILHSHVFI